jgi:hypothetical protein
MELPQPATASMRKDMALQLSLEDLIEYTDWERGKWREFLLARGDEVLKVGVGSNGDGRFQSVGDVVRHIFSAEARYIDWLSERELTDPSRVASDEVEALFKLLAAIPKRLPERVSRAAWQAIRKLAGSAPASRHHNADAGHFTFGRRTARCTPCAPPHQPANAA